MARLLRFVKHVSIRYYYAMTTDRLFALVSSLARALHSEQWARAVRAGVLPVQWTILCYLRDANRYSNTPQAVADYLGLTRGTVSQSLKRMTEHGWICRSADAVDKRIVRLWLTPAGQRLLEDNAAHVWQDVIATLPRAERDAAEMALGRVLSGWQQARAGQTFGVCRSCAHFRPGADTHRCGLTGEELSDDDGQRICREHQQSSPLAAQAEVVLTLAPGRSAKPEAER